jgi:hypothetical protein
MARYTPNDTVTVQSNTPIKDQPNVHGTFVPKDFTITHCTSLKHITSHKSRQFTPHHYTSHHFTYLHSIPTWIPLPVTTFLTLFLNVLSLQGKDASQPAIVGSNPTRGIDVCLLCVLPAIGLCDEMITRPREVLPNVVRRCLWRNLVNL